MHKSFEDAIDAQMRKFDAWMAGICVTALIALGAAAWWWLS